MKVTFAIELKIEIGESVKVLNVCKKCDELPAIPPPGTQIEFKHFSAKVDDGSQEWDMVDEVIRVSLSLIGKPFFEKMGEFVFWFQRIVQDGWSVYQFSEEKRTIGWNEPSTMNDDYDKPVETMDTRECYVCTVHVFTLCNEFQIRFRKTLDRFPSGRFVVLWRQNTG